MGIHDVCPHRGASLSKGRIDRHLNCVVCPYHTLNSTRKVDWFRHRVKQRFDPIKISIIERMSLITMLLISTDGYTI